MEPGADPNNYTIKEILTDFVIPALNDLRAQQETQRKADEERFSRLEAWKNRGVGAFIFITAILIPVAIPVIITVVNN